MVSSSHALLLRPRLPKSSTSITPPGNSLSPLHQDLPSSEQGKGWKLRKALAQTRAVVKDFKFVTPVDQVLDKPTSFASLASLLKHCAETKALRDGRLVHFHIKRFRYDRNTYLGNWLVKMYGDCGSMDDARAVFDTLPKLNCHSWNILMEGYVRNGFGKEALECFRLMQHRDINANHVTFLCALGACGDLGDIEKGREVHFAIMKAGCEGETHVGAALINMYGKCGSLDDARSVFQRLPKRDVVSWNVMISVCAQTGYGKEALHLFDQMQFHGFKPNRITYVSALDACGSLAALEKGQIIHSAIANSGYESEVVVGTALIDMYGKCGSLQEAKNVFLQLPQRNIISWNAMIAAYAQNGHGKEALDFFKKMQCDGFRPDQFTFLSVMAACRHTGHVDDARHYFVSMNQDHGIKPNKEHYLCLIDILGRAGHLDDAENLITHMPLKNVPRAWLSLLAACRVHGDVERGVRVADHVFKLDPHNPAALVLLANIYGEAGRLDDAQKGGEGLKISGLMR